MLSTLKLADRCDLEVLLGLRREFCRHEEILCDEKEARGALDEILANSSLGRVWVIEFGGATAGYVVLTFSYSLEFNSRDAFVDELDVVERYRGNGLGKLAICFVEETCRSLGIRALHLEVDRQNHMAQAVYEKAGFQDRENYLLTKQLTTGVGGVAEAGPAGSLGDCEETY